MVGNDNKKWYALALILTVQFMTILDIAIVNVALSSIQDDLGFSQENLQWVISAYALVFGGFLLLGGRSADLLGRRRVFAFGVVVFTLGSLFYSQRYWINDPWYYRLPPAYGDYRWVRYYDDALLVDVYSGRVVDVIYDFFW